VETLIVETVNSWSECVVFFLSDRRGTVISLSLYRLCTSSSLCRFTFWLE
jgi:hypothetical protein